ncbi:MAG TPA: FMN-binding protein, partial [Holophagaceae bacterium]|nr:FMN-binding protein [Holophagaceae bacterium]
MIRLRMLPLLAFAALLQALPTQQQALQLAFPGCAFTRREFFLSDAQAAQVKALSKTELPGLWFVGYEARKDGRLVGVGFFDTHRVRTENETALVAVGAEGRIRRVEVIAFREPQDYAPRQAWIDQFQGRPLNDGLSLRRDIRPLAGATLTANALTDASRRGLALWQVFY